ncbi:hypothetical protein ACLBV5_09770 [Brevundimonas sp. M1A4_2e]
MNDLKPKLATALTENYSFRINRAEWAVGLTGAIDGPEFDGMAYDGIIDLDHLTCVATDHFLDREKVRAALIAALSETIEHVNNGSFREGSFEDPDEDGYVEIEWGHSDHVLTHPALMFGDGYAPTDKLVDRLIEGLAAGGSEG